MAHKKTGAKRKPRFPKGSAQAKAWGKRMAAARKKCKTGLSKASKTPKRPKKAKAKKTGRKKPRTAAQKAATKRMIAANKHKHHPKKAHPKPKKKAAHKSKASHGGRKKKRQAAVLGAFRGGPRGGIRVAPHRGNIRCTECGLVHDLRSHHSHRHGPHNKRTHTEYSYLTTPEHIAANPKAPLRVKPPRTIQEAAKIIELEKKTGKKAVFVEPHKLTKKRVREFYANLPHKGRKGRMHGPVRPRHSEDSDLFEGPREFMGPRRASGSIH